MSRAPLRLAAAALCTALPLIAAADTTADQAASLRQQLREWIGKLVGPDVTVPDKLIAVTPEGDILVAEVSWTIFASRLKPSRPVRNLLRLVKLKKSPDHSHV